MNGTYLVQSCELIPGRTNRFHAKAQSAQRPQRKERTSTLRFLATLRLSVSCFDFFTPSYAMSVVLSPIAGRARSFAALRMTAKGSE
jgi:hypothetical protein